MSRVDILKRREKPGAEPCSWCAPFAVKRRSLFVFTYAGVKTIRRRENRMGLGAR